MSSSVITFIQTQKLTGTTSSVVFSNIPQSFRSLKLVGVARVSSTPTFSPRVFVFLDLGDGKRMYGSQQETRQLDKNALSGSLDNHITNGVIGIAATTLARANGFSSIHCDIFNYTNKKAGYFSKSTNHQSYDTTYESYSGSTYSGGVILGETPLTTMTIKPQTPYDFVADTQFWLYGIG